MTKQRLERLALLGAGLVIVALTAVAFWLSYAHLAEVAKTHGLAVSTARTWAWPGAVDAFIISGELLMLRAGLRGVRDPWAIGLTVVGSGGSIGLNVAGVAGGDASAVPLLTYIVAAVPPTAALLAFGALMRQIHNAVVGDGDDKGTRGGHEVSPNPDSTRAPAFAEPQVGAGVHPEPQPVPQAFVYEAPTLALTGSTDPEPLTICGGGHLPVPPVPPRAKLDTEAARAAIEQAHRDGLSIREAARVSTRSPSQVQRVYARLDEVSPAPIEGQTLIEMEAA